MGYVDLIAHRGPAKSPMERKLLMKLDIFILAFCCACFFFNFLDRAAFANAYVAGLKEDLNLGGNNYSTLLSMYTAGNLIGQIPHALIIQKIQPRIWLPTTLILWSGLTMCCAACKSYDQLAAVRFIQGFFEASTWSGTMYVIGSWYKPLEISKRVALFSTIGTLGSMFAGIMMTAMRTTLHGIHGMNGWQWVFIIDGAMGIPIGIFGLLFFPNLPETTTAMYLSKEEVQLAIDRMPPKVENTHSIDPRTLIKRVLRKPAIYILFVFSVHGALLEAFAFQGCFLLFLKHHSKVLPTTAPNTFPLGIQGVSIISMILAGIYIDLTDSRFAIGMLTAFMQLISAILLVIPFSNTELSLSNKAATFTGFYLSGTSFMVDPIKFGWASIIMQRGGDDAARSIVVYAMNMGGQLLYTWWGIVMYPATDSPYWKKGAIVLIVASVLFPGSLMAVDWLDKRTKPLDTSKQADSAPPQLTTSIDEKHITDDHIASNDGDSIDRTNKRTPVVGVAPSSW